MSLIYHQIKKDNQTIIETVITNIVKMLIYRKWLNLSNMSQISSFVNELIKLQKDKIYNIKLTDSLVTIDTYEPFENKTEWKNFNGNNIIVYLSDLKITGLSKILDEFKNKYVNYHKIIIVDSITDKVRQSISLNKFIEIFTESEFMINLTDHVCCPQVQVINNNEVDELLKSYGAKRKDLPKQFDLDPLSRYLFLKRGQIIRVIRNSEITGQSVSYRIIIHKSTN